METELYNTAGVSQQRLSQAQTLDPCDLELTRPTAVVGSGSNFAAPLVRLGDSAAVVLAPAAGGQQHEPNYVNEGAGQGGRNPGNH